MAVPPQSSLLAEAVEHEKRYQWQSAARCYSTFLKTSTPDTAESLELYLRVGYCLELAAAQTDDVVDSQRQITDALAIYKEIGRRSIDAPTLIPVAQARSLRLESMLSPEIVDRRILLDEAIRIHRRVVQRLQEEESSQWARAANFQLLLLRDRFLLESGARLIVLLKEALDLSQQLVARSTPPLDADTLGEAFYFRLFFAAHAALILKEWSSEFGRQALFLDEALAFAPQIQDQRVLTALHTLAADSIAQQLAKKEKELNEQIGQALQTARTTRDRSLIGQALAQAINVVRWQLVAESDEEQARVRFQEIHELFEEGGKCLRHLLDPPSQCWLSIMYADLAHSHYVYATNFVTDQKLRKQLIEEDVTLFREGSLFARRVGGFPLAYIGAVGAEALRQLATLEEESLRRQERLVEAIEIAETSVALAISVNPIDQWNIGVQYVMEGSLRSDLARQTEAPLKRQEMLVTAVDRFRVGLSKLKGPSAWLYSGQSLYLGEVNFRFVKALSNLFELTRDHRLVSEQLLALNEATEVYAKAQRPSRVAEAQWQKAKIRSLIGEHSNAAGDFARSAERYEAAANETPSLKELYLDLSLYMRSWNAIETARAAHSDGAYGKANEAYRQASSILRTTQHWTPLGHHYAACATLEEAEALSHQENPALSAQVFAKAGELFGSSLAVIASWTPQSLTDQKPGEKSRWESVTEGRKRYSYARADLEDARLLDLRGEHASSAQKFALSAAALEDLSKEEVTTEGQREMETLTLNCRAWQLMKEAEATNTAAKYGEAARLFEKASETTTNTKVSLVARGNVSFCLALQSGTNLRSTHRRDLYPKTKQYLETAAHYYTQAGMDRASSWTRATQRMFDGLVYLAQAEGELQPQRKAESYALAERSFEAAAQFYRDAGHTAKQEQSSRYLQYAREQKLVFISPAEVLDGSVVLRQSQAQTSPELTRDEPLGIESFETTNVQVKSVANRTEITLGESIEVLLEMVSAGHLPATLVKVVDLAPAGLKVETIGEKYRVEEGAIAFKGHRLEPFETLDIHLRISPTSPGDFQLRPRVLYLGPDGQYRHSQPERIMFGARATEATTVKSPPLPELETSVRTVFDYLVRAFIEDYMRRKLQLEQAGWRSLPELAQSTKVSRSSLYGTAAKHGRTIADLLSRGLVETRISTGQRGRGGEVLKLRIAYDKEPVKRHVDRVAIGSK